MEYVSPCDQDQTTQPGSEEHAARLKQAAMPFDWYATSQISVAQERQWRVIRFTDWLCRVNPMLDQALPACWASHAWPMLIMDALWVEYCDAYQDKQHNRHDPADWISQVVVSLSQIQSWSQSTNHHGANTCPAADNEYTATRITRRSTEETQGYYHDHVYMWPENHVAMQPITDRLMTSLSLNDVDA
ncbi:hypothetical protein CYJ33_06550 [Alloscardovia omnicolens]|uniref:hypothetical protein n=1 Tax=Alloscardovia omnicolens TaxID=419015 RepID=UPI000C783077|nr:hypothetical protein [Alloscardovia omnicolens]MDK6663287.1 hypothetical protein [Alloscardovia omnicolens]MDK7747221.1 hypothetical protein [Alloscardovia omnicolens]PKY78232.1 hypothetical protein CYJ33_06550 [Alloscardovia omnicolens]